MLPALDTNASAYANLTRRLQGPYASGGAYRAGRRRSSSGARAEDASLRTGPAACPRDGCGGHLTEASTVIPFRPR